MCINIVARRGHGCLTGRTTQQKARRGHVCLTREVLLSHSQGTSLCIASPGRHANLCRVPHELLPGALTGRTTHQKAHRGHCCLTGRTTTNGPHGAKLPRMEDNHQRTHGFQPRLNVSINDSLDDILWIAKPFVTKASMVIHHYKPVSCAKNGLLSSRSRSQ